MTFLLHCNGTVLVVSLVEMERLNRSCVKHLQRWNIPINYGTALKKLNL